MTTLRRSIAALLAVLLGGCASYKATLTNAQGQTMTCEASGKNGIITGSHVRGAFDDCIAAAKAQGFTEQASPATSAATKPQDETTRRTQ